MRIRVDDRLRDEAARLAFRFACEDCVHFAPAGDRCSLGHPPEPRRHALAGAGPEPDGHLETCKDFDLV
jgi:hypothetical protein